MRRAAAAGLRLLLRSSGGAAAAAPATSAAAQLACIPVAAGPGVAWRAAQLQQVAAFRSLFRSRLPHSAHPHPHHPRHPVPKRPRSWLRRALGALGKAVGVAAVGLPLAGMGALVVRSRPRPPALSCPGLDCSTPPGSLPPPPVLCPHRPAVPALCMPFSPPAANPRMLLSRMLPAHAEILIHRTLQAACRRSVPGSFCAARRAVVVCCCTVCRCLALGMQTPQSWCSRSRAACGWCGGAPTPPGATKRSRPGEKSGQGAGGGAGGGALLV